MSAPDLTMHGTISLGGLISRLGRRPSDQCVYFDFANFVPTDVDSYRGYYDHLALDFDSKPVRATVAGLLKTLRGACGREFHGYKGGLYVMGLETPIWVAAWGESTSTAIVGLADCDYSTVIETRWIP